MAAFIEKRKKQKAKMILKYRDLVLVVGVTLELFLETVTMCRFS